MPESHTCFARRYNVSPGSTLPVVMQAPRQESERELTPLRWGLGRTRDSDAFKAFNARGEELKDKPLFKPLLHTHRCVVLVNGFYEWNSEPSAGKLIKQPYYIHCGDGSDSEAMLLAGLSTFWNDSCSTGDGIPGSCTIITVSSSSKLKWLHDRMPAVLPDENAVSQWLSDASFDDVKHLLQPFDGDALNWWPVTRRMSMPSFDSIEACRPAERAATKGASNITKFFGHNNASPSAVKREDDAENTVQKANVKEDDDEEKELQATEAAEAAAAFLKEEEEKEKEQDRLASQLSNESNGHESKQVMNSSDKDVEKGNQRGTKRKSSSSSGKQTPPGQKSLKAFLT
jgi:putative SOS response-associated peptidase YedK